jgi:hypothetical protein
MELFEMVYASRFRRLHESWGRQDEPPWGCGPEEGTA